MFTKIKVVVSKEERKALVKAVAEITRSEAKYQKAPSFAYEVCDFIIDRYGSLLIDDSKINAKDVAHLLTELIKYGYDLEIDEKYRNVNEDSDRLTIEYPIKDFTPTALDNLRNLVTAKSWILKKMTGAEDLTIMQNEEKLSFPWFKANAEYAEINVYSQLVTGLCNTAKNKQRISANEKQLQDGDNEKYKARCFLLSINFKGSEYSQARKILLKSFSGNGSHCKGSGNGKTAAKSEFVSVIDG